MRQPLPLPALLSQALVAFTIEFDDEFEHRMPHRTTRSPASASGNGPWLVSQAMWSNFLRFVPAEGLPLRELEGWAHLTNLNGLIRWRYITVAPPATDNRPSPPRADGIVSPTRQGRLAQKVWQPLAGLVEARWGGRFGADDIGGLRDILQSLSDRVEAALELAVLPEYLPVVYDHMFTEVPKLTRLRAFGGEDPVAHPDLTTLLSRVLLAFTLDAERDLDVALPMGANALRALTEAGIAVRDLPRLSGVSKEAIAMSLGFLEKRGLVTVAADPAGGRVRVARLTADGVAAQQRHHRTIAAVEESWVGRFGGGDIRNLRRRLERLVVGPDLQAADTAATDDAGPDTDGPAIAGGSPLMAGWEPYPNGWRAAARRPETLPHYPMVLHRGGYPDGS